MPSVGKELMLEELLDVMKSKSYIFFSQYQALTVSDFSDLRRKLEKVSDRAIVVKNSIARIAFEKMGVKDVNGFIKGSILLTFGEKEPQAISKVLVDFSKDRKNFRVAGASLEGQLCKDQYIKELAALPSREVLVATVVNGLNAPIGGFVNTLGQLVRSIAVVLDQVSKQKSTT
jgi:large subunit ribosomal protein L10